MMIIIIIIITQNKLKCKISAVPIIAALLLFMDLRGLEL